MVYKTEPQKLGITIKISTHRKHGNGAVGGGRKGSTGKKAIITQSGEESVTLTRGTATDLLREVRRKFKIPPNIRINESGVTSI